MYRGVAYEGYGRPYGTLPVTRFNIRPRSSHETRRRTSTYPHGNDLEIWPFAGNFDRLELFDINQDLRLNLRIYKRKTTRLEEENFDLYEELSRTKKRMANTKQECERIRGRLKNLKDFHERRVYELDLDLKGLMQQQEYFRNRIYSLERELLLKDWDIFDARKTQRQLETRYDEIKRLQASADEQNRIISRLKSEVQRLENQLIYKDSLIQRLGEENHRIKRESHGGYELISLRTENKDLREKIFKLEKERKTDLKKITDLSEKLDRERNSPRHRKYVMAATFPKKKSHDDEENQHFLSMSDDLKAGIVEKDNEIRELQQCIEELKEGQLVSEEDFKMRLKVADQKVKDLEKQLREQTQNFDRKYRDFELKMDNRDKDDKKDEHLYELRKMEKEIQKNKKENDTLSKQVENAEQQNKFLLHQISDLEKKEKKTRLACQKAETTLEEKEKEIQQLRRLNSDTLKELEDLKTRRSQEDQLQVWVDAELSKKDEEIRSLQNNIKKLSSENMRVVREREELEKEKEEALTRLSKAAGAKLTQGNPAITDLSDDNRPTKIAEKFSEIYDNLWTDAFEELAEHGLDDLTIIDLLLQVLKDAYQTCKEKEQIYDSTITEAVHLMPGTLHGSVNSPPGSPSSKIQSNAQIRKTIVDIKLALGPTGGRRIAELHMPHLEKSLQQSIPSFGCTAFPKTAEYGRQCTILCWLMRIRDPSVHIDFSCNRGGRFDGDLFRQYTKPGTKADYLVWPILYLHEGGPMLAKGVAQPM